MARVLFLFPAGKNLPTGGLKVVYDYAGQLIKDGHQVIIAYAAYFSSTDQSVRRKLKAVAKYVYLRVMRQGGYTWYSKNPEIREVFVWKLNYSSLPKADVYVATAVCTAPYVNLFPVSGEKKFYFIQGYESFIVPNDKFIRWTYRLPLKKIVISRWLSKLVAEEGSESIIVPNGFDSSVYKLTIPIEEKDKFLVSMLYHVNVKKDTNVGMAAVKLAKKRIPELRLVMFGAYPKPENLPDWVEYHRSPSRKTHLEINNRASIYVGCSRIEGWGLTIGEAMMCGQAVACTDNDGYKEMATDNANALVTPVGDVDALAASIVRLVSDDQLRHRLASKGMDTIKAFDFNESYKKFRNAIIM